MLGVPEVKVYLFQEHNPKTALSKFRQLHGLQTAFRKGKSFQTSGMGLCKIHGPLTWLSAWWEVQVRPEVLAAVMLHPSGLSGRVGLGAE